MRRLETPRDSFRSGWIPADDARAAGFLSSSGWRFSKRRNSNLFAGGLIRFEIRDAAVNVFPFPSIAFAHDNHLVAEISTGRKVSKHVMPKRTYPLSRP